MSGIFIITGHGAGDSGACGNGYQEAERVRALANRIKVLGGNDVLLCDMSRNYYADNGIGRLTIPKDYQIVELHMDSGASTARGGHVIINGCYSADQYDKALAEFISGILPGRARTLVGRTDLANPNRAAVKGYSYRLIECGFISNATDVDIFNSRMDDIARGILKCFGITAKTAVWKKDSVGWWYQNADGSYPFSTWKKIGGKWYYFDAKGYMVTGWQRINEKWFFLEESGAMMENRWFNDSGKNYYFKAGGYMASNEILKIDGKYYAFFGDGSMASKMEEDGSIL